MAFRKLKPVNNGTRATTVPDFAELTRSRPEKKLVRRLKVNAGRNNQGRITCRHKGGGHARLYRQIDFKRNKLDVVGKVVSVEYDPNRNCRICLVAYADGEKRYILQVKGLEVGASIVDGSAACEPNIGNSMELRYIPQGLSVHNIELQPGRGGQMARSAGAFAQLMAVDGDYAILLLPSGELRRVLATCRATIGEVGNAEFNLRNHGKAGRMRWLGVRPTVRGNAQNPVSHPLGGGEGHTNGGRQHCSPWGLVDGVKTRRINHPTDKFIIRRRKKNR